MSQKNPHSAKRNTENKSKLKPAASHPMVGQAISHDPVAAIEERSHSTQAQAQVLQSMPLSQRQVMMQRVNQKFGNQHASDLARIVQGKRDQSIQREGDDEEKDIKTRLREAMEGWGTDEASIMQIVSSASDTEKKTILNDAALVSELQSELSRGDMLQVLTHLNAPVADRLRTAIRGWGTDEAAIQTILTGASKADRDAALADTTLMKELEGDLSAAEMLTIFKSSGAEFKTIVGLAFDPWSASFECLQPHIEAASKAERETVWSDSTLMDKAAAAFGEDVYLNYVVALGMKQTGVTAEDGKSHTHAADADEGIQEHLADYVKGAVKDGKQIEGLVGVVGDDDWDRAGIAHYGKTTWEGGKRDRINGFVDSSGRVWIHKDRGNVGTMVHEAIHKYSDRAMIGISQPLNEGVTEYFTRLAAPAMGLDISSRGNYQSNYDAVVVLSTLVTEKTLAEAYFDGSTSELRTAFIDKKSEDDWNKFVEHTKKNEWADAERLATP